MLSNVDPQGYITCPYNPSHRLLNFRMQCHLVKCRSGNLDMTLSQCPFNYTHQVPEPELRHHMENCVNRLEMDQHVYTSDQVNRDRYPILQNNNAADPDEESWDNDADVKSYYPEDHIQERPLLRKLDVQSQATRRGFRLDERQRFSNLEHARREEENIMAPPSRRRPQQMSAGLNEPSRNIEVEDPAGSQRFVPIGQNVSRGEPDSDQLDEAAAYTPPIWSGKARPLSEILKNGNASVSPVEQSSSSLSDSEFPALGGRGRGNTRRGRGFAGGRGRGRY